MERFVLFISEPGSDDIVDIHPNKPAAETALVEYVLSLIHISEPTRPY